jgi:UDP-glucuronate decarboxylase
LSWATRFEPPRAAAARCSIVTRSKLTFVGLPQDDPRQRRPDISRAEELCWSPTVALRDGLQRTISYFDKLLAERARG